MILCVVMSSKAVLRISVDCVDLRHCPTLVFIASQNSEFVLRFLIAQSLNARTCIHTRTHTDIHACMQTAAQSPIRADSGAPNKREQRGAERRRAEQHREPRPQSEAPRIATDSESAMDRVRLMLCNPARKVRFFEHAIRAPKELGVPTLSPAERGRASIQTRPRTTIT